MKDNDVFESNRAAWNQAHGYHQKARGNSLQRGFKDPDFTTLDRDCDEVLISKVKEIGLNGKTISQIPCNNGRELLSLMRLGAKEAMGFDISDAAILEAKELADIAELNAKFVRTNILEIGDEYNDRFDFIYISEGSLQWFPDLNEYFSVVSRLLRKNGNILIFEIHPFAYLFEKGFNLKEQGRKNSVSYFERGPYSYKDGMDYVGGVQYEAKECNWFMHKMSDILNAVSRNGIEVIEFSEYDLEMANNPEAMMQRGLPLSYIIVGRKK